MVPFLASCLNVSVFFAASCSEWKCLRCSIPQLWNDRLRCSTPQFNPRANYLCSEGARNINGETDSSQLSLISGCSVFDTNAANLGKKLAELRHATTVLKPDFVFVTEMHLNSVTPENFNFLQGYYALRRDRTTQDNPNPHGGIVVLSCPVPRGKVLGGSSGTNGMMHVRGNKRDYDNWAYNLGCNGWSWKEVFPYFLKSEDNTDLSIANNGYHKTGGYLTVSPQSFSATPVQEAYLEVGRVFGMYNPDYNGASQMGIGPVYFTQRYGSRCSTAKAFLYPARHRNNLHILVRAFAVKILFNKQKQARSVVFHFKSSRRIVHARLEIIVSAGVINSPQLLMLSGIGPKDHLDLFQIPVTSYLPAGQNLHDHATTFAAAFITNISSTETESTLNTDAYLQYFLKGKGFLTDIGIQSTGFLKAEGSKRSSDWPDIQIAFMLSTVTALGSRTNEFRDMFEDYSNSSVLRLNPVLLNVKSRGYVQLKSTDPYDYPLINPKFLTEPEDVGLLVDGLRRAPIIP